MKVLISRETWNSNKGQMFYQLTSVDIGNEDLQKFVDLVYKLDFIPLVVGEYEKKVIEIYNSFNELYTSITFLWQNLDEFLRGYINFEKEYSCGKEEADIVREYMGEIKCTF